MAILKTYRNPEDAYIDAAYLSSQGIEAVVDQDPAFGGALFGVVESAYRLDVHEAEVEAAKSLLDERSPETPPSSPPPKSTPVDTAKLTVFFNFILTFDIVCMVAFAFFGDLILPSPPAPVTSFLKSLVLSDTLWQLANACLWPLVAARIVSCILCFFYFPFGRSLFVFTTAWNILNCLALPTTILSPHLDFLVAIQGTLSAMALALMYWSPLREMFMDPSLD